MPLIRRAPRKADEGGRKSQSPRDGGLPADDASNDGVSSGEYEWDVEGGGSNVTPSPPKNVATVSPLSVSPLGSTTNQYTLRHQHQNRPRRRQQYHPQGRGRGNFKFQWSTPTNNKRFVRNVIAMMPAVCCRYCSVVVLIMGAIMILLLVLSLTISWFVQTGRFVPSTPPGKNYWQRQYWQHRRRPGLQLSHRINDDEKFKLEALKLHFPLHVGPVGGDGWEIVDHPGHLLLPDNWEGTMEKYLRNETLAASIGVSHPDEIRKRLISNVTVPRFWNGDGVFESFGGVRNFLGEQGQYLMAPEEAAVIGSYYRDDRLDSTPLATILVLIASYRDPECHPTVENLLERATHPQRIRVAVVDQRINGVDDSDDNGAAPKCGVAQIPCLQDPEQILCRYANQIDRAEYDARSMVGPVFARHLAYRMYRGEYFVLQVDSHVRFVTGWDEDIISQWKSADNEMAVLTTYMNDITQSIDPETHVSLRPQRAVMCRLEYEWLGDWEHIKFNIQPIKIPPVKDAPMLHPFWAAGFSFARGHFVVQVPYDPYLPFVFQGEEILQTVRGFTHGYDYYAPIRNVAFHIYAMKENTEKRQGLHKFDENELLYPGVKKEAYKRLIGISGTTSQWWPPRYFDRDEEFYGLGHVRSKSQFFSTFGIHPNTRTIASGLCDFVQGTGVTKSMHAMFSPLLRFDKMGIDYDRIGYRHKTPDRSDTPVDPKELEILREIVRQKNRTDKENETAGNQPSNDFLGET